MEKTIEMMKLLKWSNDIEFNNLNKVLRRSECEWQKNIYFCAGVRKWLSKRCNDDDIESKNYFAVDIDIRLDCYNQVWVVLDHEQLLEHMEEVISKIADAGLDDYSIAVCSWNWLHLYYVGTERKIEKMTYSHWVQMIYENINNAIKSTGYKCDPACHNISRIMRLPWTINPRLKIKKDEILRDLWDYTCDVMMFDPKISKLYEWIEQYAEQYEKEKEKEKEDAKIIHQIVKSERKKPNDIWVEINSIPSCDVACDIRPITISDKWSDNVALKESHKNMGAYWYRPNNIIVNTWSSLIKTNKNHFTTYELIFYEYANQDKQKTLEYFKTKYNIEVKSEKKSFDIQPIKYEKQWYLYPSEIFDPFECVMSWELVTIVAPSHSWKTTFAMDMIQRNSWIDKKCFYINLEFAIETVRQNRRLYANWKTKKNITDLDPLTEQERSKMNDYVQKNLKKFEYFNDPKGITLQELVELIQSKHNQWYWLFVLDTFSKIDWNLDSKVSHTSQNNSMQVLQELCQNLWVVVILLHHTNKKWEFEGSQKIMDLSNVFISITKDEWFWENVMKYTLSKDKFVSSQEIETVYRDWKIQLL